MYRQLLTPREKEIVELLLNNHSNASIAQQLNSTKKAISVRLCQIYIKFRVNKQPNPRELLVKKIKNYKDNLLQEFTLYLPPCIYPLELNSACLVNYHRLIQMLNILACQIIFIKRIINTFFFRSKNIKICTFKHHK